MLYLTERQAKIKRRDFKFSNPYIGYEDYDPYEDHDVFDDAYEDPYANVYALDETINPKTFPYNTSLYMDK